MTPTILRISPGDTVTFVNRDPMVHNVVANGWGHFDDLSESDRFTASFPEPGVYPFACTYHPGMTGAIVVGDGEGSGSGVVMDATPPQVHAAANGDGEGASSAAGWIVVGAIALVAGSAGGYVLATKRGRVAAGTSET
ncbi:MAG: plastocyanin/azurin family copper-binding protein, partial [Actinomycetota bacterium]